MTALIRADGDDEAVDDPGRRADRDAEQNAEDGRTGPSDGERDADRRHADHRADGNIKSAGNDDDRLRGGENSENGDGLADVEDVAQKEEDVGPQAAEDAR